MTNAERVGLTLISQQAAETFARLPLPHDTLRSRFRSRSRQMQCRLPHRNNVKDVLPFAAVPERAIGGAVELTGSARVVRKLFKRTGAVVKPLAEPVRRRKSQFGRPGMRVVRCYRRKLLFCAELSVTHSNCACGSPEPSRLILNPDQQRPRCDRDVQIDVIHTIQS